MASALRRARSRTAGKRKGLGRTAQPRASASFADVDEAVQGITQAPPSQKDELRRRASKQVLQTLQQMRSDGAARLFGSERDSDGSLQLQQTAQWQLKTVGIKNPSAIAEQGTERFATLTCTTLQHHLGSQDGLSMLADSAFAASSISLHYTLYLQARLRSRSLSFAMPQVLRFPSSLVRSCLLDGLVPILLVGDDE